MANGIPHEFFFVMNCTVCCFPPNKNKAFSRSMYLFLDLFFSASCAQYQSKQRFALKANTLSQKNQRDRPYSVHWQHLSLLIL